MLTVLHRAFLISKGKNKCYSNFQLVCSLIFSPVPFNNTLISSGAKQYQTQDYDSNVQE